MHAMTSRLNNFGKGFRVWRATAAAVTVFMLALLAFAGLAAQAAAVETSGSFSATLGYGSAGQALKKAGVRTSAVGPSTGTNLSGKRVRIDSNMLGASGATQFSLVGGVRFNKGKRSVVVRDVSVNTETGRIIATAAGKRMVFFLANLDSQVDEAAGTLRITGGKLRLSAGSARLIKSKLRIRRLPAAQVGGLSGNVTFAFEDPYFEQCGLAATSRSVGNVPEAAPVPTGGLQAGSNGIRWGFKASFNGYINGIGLITGLDGTTVNRVPMAPPQVPPTGFTFPGAQGAYAENGPGSADDQGYVNGSGGVMYCNAAHGFRIAISNPTVVIDSESSRIIADVDTNISGDWMPTQRVDLADLDTGAATFSSGGKEFTWANIPATLSQTGADALRLCEVNVPGGPPGCIYPAGTALDNLTITFRYP